MQSPHSTAKPRHKATSDFPTKAIEEKPISLKRILPPQSAAGYRNLHAFCMSVHSSLVSQNCFRCHRNHRTESPCIHHQWPSRTSAGHKPGTDLAVDPDGKGLMSSASESFKLCTENKAPTYNQPRSAITCTSVIRKQ